MENTLETDRAIAEIHKLVMDALKSQAEAAKIATETKWYPLAIGAALFGAAAAFAKLFL
jgi:hypothetical protein